MLIGLLLLLPAPCQTLCAQEESTPAAPTLPAVEELINEYQKLTDKALKERRQIIAQLGQHRKAEAQTFLEEIYNSSTEPAVHAAVLNAMASIPSATLFERYRAILRNPKDYKNAVIQAALGKINQMPGPWQDALFDFVDDHPKHRYAYLAIWNLARSKDPLALKKIRSLYNMGDDNCKRSCIDYGSQFFGIAKTERQFILPQLESSAPPILRNAALSALSRGRDLRFFKFGDQQAKSETAANALKSWISWAQPFDSLRALKFMISLLDPDSTVLQNHFVTTTKKLKSKAVQDWFFAKGYRHLDPTIRRAAAEQISRRKTPEAQKILMAMAKDQAQDVALEALRGLRSPQRSCWNLLRSLSGDSDEVIAAQAMRALWDQEEASDRARAYLTKIATRSRRWKMRIAAIRQLKRHDAPKAREVFFGNLDHKRKPVRWAAYDALTYVRDRETVTRLIPRLKVEKSRSLREVNAALYYLTGVNYGHSYSRWNEWWSRVGADFPLPKRPQTEIDTKVKESDYAGNFYGLEIISKRVCFLIDISGSMGTKSGKSTRIELAKKQLRQAIRGLNKTTKFNVIAFNQGLIPLAPKLIPAKKAEKAAAIRWVGNLTAVGGTNIYDSLIQALGDQEVDAIYLLSDGAPSAGKITDTGEILTDIRRRNLFDQVSIHVVDISAGRSLRRFLKQLAKGNFGDYTRP